MRKVCVVIASRQNYGRLKSVLEAVTNHPQLQLQLVVAASAVDFPIEYTPDATIQCLIDGDNHQAMALTTGVFLTQIGGVFDRLKPDVVLVHGDRHELLAAASAASYMNIPLAHTEGGEVTGSIDGKVRNAITALADIHFPVTEQARTEIILRGATFNSVHVVGSTALDPIKEIHLTDISRPPYIVILHHPNTTEPEGVTPLIEAVRGITLHKVWVNPNVDAGSGALLKAIHREDVEFVKNLPPDEYIKLIHNSECLVGNTSSGIKEGAFLGIPYVCVGNRQRGRERGANVKFVGYDELDILMAISEQVRRGKYPVDYRFGDGTAGQRIASILAGVKL